MATIGSLFGPAALPPAAAPERTGYYQALFDDLAAREPIDDAALRRLARFRVRSTAAALAEHGDDPARVVQSGEEVSQGGSMLRVPVSVGPSRVEHAEE